MSGFNGSGTFNISGVGLPYVSGTTISSAVANQLNTDLAAGLSNCITKDGQQSVQANIPFNNYKITQIGTATAATDAASVTNIQNATGTFLSVTGTNTIVATATPAITGYVAGMTFRFVAAGTNVGPVTINVSGLGAKAITKEDSQPLEDGDINSGYLVSVTYDGTNFVLQSGIGGGSGLIEQETQTATSGQTVFTLAGITYTPGTNNLCVFVDGVKQYVGSSYTETNITTVTFSSGLHTGASVQFIVFSTVEISAMTSANVPYTPAGTGAVITNVQAKLRETVSIFDFMTAAQIADVQAGTLTIDCVAAINAANTYLASRPTGGTLFFPNGVYLTLSGITIPAYVNWRGESPGWVSGTNQKYGVIIYKQHISNAITLNKTIPGGQYLENIGIVGRGALDVGGSGFVVTTAADVEFYRCNVWHIYEHAFVIGDGSASCYACVINDCYSNNPETGSSFVINSTLFRGHKMISDGGLWGATFSVNATNWSIGDCHFEGFKTGGISASNPQGKTYGKTTIAGTTTTGLIGISANGVANAIAFTGFLIQFSAVRAGSIGLSLQDTSVSISLRDSTIALAEIGVSDVSTGTPQATIIDNVTFSNCTKGIYTSANYTRYVNNKFVSTTTYDVEHIGGTRGLWQGNKMSKTGDNAFKPTFSTQSGNFNYNAVKDNAGYVSRNSGYISSLASGSTINHGLAVAPLQNGSVITITPTTNASGITSPISVYSPGATTFNVSWTGTTPNSFTWEARLLCDY